MCTSPSSKTSKQNEQKNDPAASLQQGRFYGSTAQYALAELCGAALCIFWRIFLHIGIEQGCGAFAQTGAGTFGVILRRAGLRRAAGHRLYPGQKVPAEIGAMGGLKAVGQLLHAGVMRLLALVRRDVRIRIQQPDTEASVC